MTDASTEVSSDATTEPIIELRHVTKSYPVKGSKEVFDALSDINLTIDRGEIFAIIGGSGAGKSTAVRLINALERPTSGQVFVEGVDLGTLRGKAIRSLRTRVSMVFQQFNLLNSRTVYANVDFALEVAGYPKAQRRNRIAELLHFVGLADKAWEYPTQLSGGQKQRVGIARALAANPSVLLADEATSALDPQTTNDVLTLLKRVNDEFGITVVVITHEMDVVRKLATRVAVLDKGRLVEEGDVYDVFAHPQARLTKSIVEDSLHGRPNAAETATLTARYTSGTFISVPIGEHTAVGDILADVTRSTDLGFEFVYGGISALQGRSVGNITLLLKGSDEAVAAAIARLRESTPEAEVLGSEGVAS
ncbi:MAG TPA: methionine ABC transporter ATP-binding protein [Gordonia sp. (in: high G+C Gram-positive bacteria)]|uniref:methionine ABC transporter ATP-binding protein n=1 Tax=unclassified Gordonia (in: high G+C Gram-positive bacteria) TaxID=2657482 RepID=UPI000FAA71EE|nr:MULTISPECIES: methionine ABC transporter ATP-binding protein [unclassified Gordonia (in: high G+C Gram-positive bacteria)]RUP39515.1 MAG: methionine ABC transporter ATP-binding protein [Gordonia sp. (in: high G+C Gram-positive bacteria)]HNP57576.1 methionine ABC transporter ATP-binding protein [Gordonia sp. (in: high G+C Gram-positive bacteria)]HRC49589.1 methionine ABC transporter ATP-binding protein [Gordonia sp. (in: high G+C Gram-positive bacteria)]